MSDNQGKNKLIAKNTVFLAIRQVVAMIIALFISRITLKVLGINDFGIYSVVGGFVSVFTFLNSAFSTGIQRFYNYEFGKNGSKGANKVFVNAILVQAILAIIIVILLESVGIWYMYEKMVIPENRFTAAIWVFQISVFSTVIMMLQVPYNAAILAHEKMDFFAFLTIFNQLLRLLIVILLQFMHGDKLILYGLLFLLVTILDLLINLIYSHYNFDEINFSRKFDKSLLRQMLFFSGWNVFGKFSYIMREQGVNLLLNLFFGPAINAARALAFQVTIALNGFVSNVQIAVKPQLTQSYASGDIKRTFFLFYIISRISFFILFVLALPVCLEIDFILNIWLGHDSVPQYTGIFVVLVSFVVLIDTLFSPISFVVHATGIMKNYQLITGCIELLLVPLAYVALMTGKSPIIVFIIAIIVNAFNYFVGLLILKRIVDYSIRHYMRNVFLPLLLFVIFSIPMPYLSRMFLDEGFFRCFVVVVVSTLSSFLCFYLLGIKKDERGIAKSWLQQIVKKYKFK